MSKKPPSGRGLRSYQNGVRRGRSFFGHMQNDPKFCNRVGMPTIGPPRKISSCSEHALMSRHIQGMCFGFTAGKIIENSQRFEMALNFTCLLAMSVQTYGNNWAHLKDVEKNLRQNRAFAPTRTACAEEGHFLAIFTMTPSFVIG